MGLGGVNIWQLLIILVIVVLIFGTKRLKGLGGDLGGAIKSFRKAMDSHDNDNEAAEPGTEPPQIASDDEADAQFAEQQKEEHRS